MFFMKVREQSLLYTPVVGVDPVDLIFCEKAAVNGIALVRAESERLKVPVSRIFCAAEQFVFNADAELSFQIDARLSLIHI